MTRHLVALALAALGLATISACSINVDGGDNVSQQVGTDAFRVGGHVNLTDPVQGDAFLAGGQVSTANEIGSDLIVAAGEVSVGGSVGDDLYAAGGNVKVDAIVHGSARVGGGDVTFGPATVVAGSTTITGGRIDFQGNSHGLLRMTGGSVAMSGQAHGDVEVRAEELTILPGTQVAGRLVYHGPVPPDVPDGVLIAGGIEFHPGDSGDYLNDESSTITEHSTGWFGSLVWFAGVFAMGALFLALLPGMSSRASMLIGIDPWKSLGVGLGVLVFLPIVMAMLAITLVGIPLALLLLLVYLVLMFLGWIVGASFLGQKALALAPGDHGAGTGWRMLALLVALAALTVVGRVPVIGSVVGFLVLIAGMGALVSQGWSSRDTATSGG